MAKFFGTIGYVLEASETRPGVWEESVVEHPALGDVLSPSIATTPGDKVNDDISSGNTVSIVMDAYARHHYSAIKYVNMEGVLWRVAERTVAYPRMNLRLGGVYSGPTPRAPSTP
jgi:hypothetical protein